MFTVLVIIHVIACIFLIGVVLVNVSKGSEIGAVFTGSQAIFGGAGPGTFLNKVTTALAIVFFVTSLALTYLSTKKSTGSLMEKAPAVEETIPTPTAPPTPQEGPMPEQPAPEKAIAPKATENIPTPPSTTSSTPTGTEQETTTNQK